MNVLSSHYFKKMLLILLSCSLVPLLIFSLTSLSLYNRYFSQSMQENAEKQLGRIDREIDRLLTPTARLAQTCAGHMTVKNVLSYMPGTVEIKTLGDVLADLAEQTRQAVLHSDYPYASTTYSRPVEQDTICFLYQENLTDIHSISRIGIEAEELEDPCAASQGSLDVEIRDVGDKTILFLDYAAGLYRRETIKRYGEILTAAASRILACRNHPEITIGEILSDLSV